MSVSDFVGIGFGEVLFILVIGILVLGPRRLPEMAARLGKEVRRLTDAYAELNRSVTAEMEREKQEIKQAVSDTDDTDPSDTSNTDSELEAK